MPATSGHADLSDVPMDMKSSRSQGDQRCSWVCEKGILHTGKPLMQSFNIQVLENSAIPSQAWSQCSYFILTPCILGCLSKQSNRGQWGRQTNYTEDVNCTYIAKMSLCSFCCFSRHMIPPIIPPNTTALPLFDWALGVRAWLLIGMSAFPVFVG